MDPTEINIAIATACGWKDLSFSTNWLTRPDGKRLIFDACRETWENFVPDYYNDLNAMHEVEKSLLKSERDRYNLALTEVVTGYALLSFESAAISATAPQRCKAFLMVQGLWKD